MNLKKFLINLLMITFAFSSIAEEKVLKIKIQNTVFTQECLILVMMEKNQL